VIPKLTKPQHQLGRVLIASSLVSLLFYAGRVAVTTSFDYWFMSWNLFLAWVPLGFAAWLLHRLKTSAWKTPGNIILTLLWLGFLPNTFYIASDIIHLQPANHISVLYDVVMMLSFTFNGFLLGYLSLFRVHRQLRRRFSPRQSQLMVAVVLLLCSFAIYLGRYLRWNSWDVLINPAGIIFDVSEPFISPTSHPQAFTTTLMFFVLLGSIYAVIYRLIQIARASSHDL
jgi:uncharacterized membrane protein